MSLPGLRSRVAVRRVDPILILAVALAILPPFARAPGALAVTPRATLPTIERQVMCVTCKIPLNVAESQQADRERAFIRGLIAQGDSEAQIKGALVAQYGSTVLALPSAKGFGVAAYLVPGAVVLGLLALLALLLPSWRRHARAYPEGHILRGAGRQAGQTTEASGLSPADAARLDADLERFD